ncbi:ferritin-like domain-containing protein [Arthrobacter sp. I2-34]|uniref:Ferritin-like domain-containing protein n=1 Tax=Arthrobacter hankyongi TaxID=2904801 RepID=A0ABS9L116_9MICC|nr:DUF4439 domain-containing protein [Arthrobacter hankyongi]MCG2620382.1 ferritin-like domain-containing protein [Arthrobacter hankyongi]
MLLAAALVVGTGTIVTKPGAGSGPQDTTEQARLQAAAQLQSLAGDFEVLAAARGGDILADTAALLASQTRLLGPAPDQATPAPSGISAPSDASTPSGASAPSGASTPSGAATPGGAAASVGLGESTRRLAVVSRSLLSTAQDVEPGLARLLASIGAADYTQAALLQRETGTPAELPKPWQYPGGSWAASCTEPGDPPSGASSESAAPTGRPTTRDALAGVVVSERKLAYVYEAALPRLTGTAREEARKRYLQHRALIEAWTGVSRSLCVQLPPAEAAYELPARLATAPGQVLAEAETGAAASLADLVALSAGDLRARACADLLGAVGRIADTAGNVPAAPGLGSAAEPAATGPAPAAS